MKEWRTKENEKRSIIYTIKKKKEIFPEKMTGCDLKNMEWGKKEGMNAGKSDFLDQKIQIHCLAQVKHKKKI